MKVFYILVLVFLAASPIVAQQEEQFTQFMHYKLAFNPAAAGSEVSPIFTAVVRSQWLGLEGAPETQALTFNMPILNQRSGAGGSLLRRSIGLNSDYELNGSYAYRPYLGRGWLAIGIQGSMRLIRTDYTRATAIQPIESDAAIPMGIQSKLVPNFGVGIYYQDIGDRFFFGVSVPRLLEVNIDLADAEGVISRETQHAYVMGGAKIKLIDTMVVLQPQVLVKIVRGAPFDADINFNVVFNNKFLAGLSYRTGGSKVNSFGESLALLLGIDLGQNLMFGISYDATLSELRKYANGSVEGVVRYRIWGKAPNVLPKIDDGRFF